MTTTQHQRTGWHTADRCPDLPNVAHPPGARPDDSPLPYRILLGDDRGIDGVDTDRLCVQVSAVQFSDGRVDDGSVHEPPRVYVRDDALSAAQARELAALLIEAADVIDGWVGR